MSIDVKTYRHVLTILDIELFDTILSEDTEHTLAWILPWHLNDILLRHPRVTSA